MTAYDGKILTLCVKGALSASTWALGRFADAPYTMFVILSMMKARHWEQCQTVEMAGDQHLPRESQTHHRGQKCHEESRWESCLYIYENEQRHKERMWKKDLDHYVHDSQRVIHDEVYELLNAHSGVSSIKSCYQSQSGSQWHCRIVCFGRLVGRPESSELKEN